MKRNAKRFLTGLLAMVMVVTMLGANLPTALADNIGSEFAAAFKNPGNEYRPKVRWWWPGGDVTSEELVREIQVLSKAGFGGAEIQPFDYSLNDAEMTDPNSPIKDFMTDSFLQKVSDALTQAQKLDMIMDINMGSGYCAGASFVGLDENEKTLLSADITVNENQQNAAIPALGPNYMYDLFTPGVPNNIRPGWHTMNYMPENAELISLYAAKIVSGERNADYKILNDTVTLDLSTVEVIADFDAQAGTFNWTCPDPAAKWQIIAVYGMPVGSNPIGSVEVGAPGETAYMVDALNYAASMRYYENWLEQLKPLMKYTDDGTLRAAFNDSYEFFAQRIYTDGLLDTFKQVNGYDATPYLPSLLMPGKNQVASFFVPNRASEYSFADESGNGTNTRINYDYDKAIAAKLIEGWYEASAQALGNSPLLFRQQGYNPPMDRIKATSYEDIPEAENNTVVTNKVISSGAHFYDKPAVSAETFVFYTDEDGAGNYKITPETYRQQADLMITSGVNEMIYHGFPYVYNDENNSYGVQNWSAFSSPYSGYDIPTTFSEYDSFFPYVKSLNDYVARLQYLMKQGTPSVDVLVYLPLFASETSSQYTEVTKLLDANGIAWDWVNEELLESASGGSGALTVNGKNYDALILPNINTIELSAMQAVNKLSADGVPVAVYGTAPSKQPSYQDGNYQPLDAQVNSLSAAVTARGNSPLISSQAGLVDFINNYANPDVGYLPNENLNFVRRDYGDMGNLMFVRNLSSAANEYTLTFDQSVTKAYVMDARTGEIHQADVKNGSLSGTLAGMDSVAVLLSDSPQFASGLLSDQNPLDQPEITDIDVLDSWNLTVTGQDITDYSVSGADALGLWRDNETLKYCSDPGLYTTTFTLDSIDKAKDYILKLGTLYGVPEISVNGSAYIAVPMAPYELDITKFLQKGENTVTVKLVVAVRNRLIGYALFGEDGNGLNRSHYAQFANASPCKTGMTTAASIIAVPAAVTDDSSIPEESSSSEGNNSDPSSGDGSSQVAPVSDGNNPGTETRPFDPSVIIILCMSGLAAAITLVLKKRNGSKI